MPNYCVGFHPTDSSLLEHLQLILYIFGSTVLFELVVPPSWLTKPNFCSQVCCLNTVFCGTQAPSSCSTEITTAPFVWLAVVLYIKLLLVIEYTALFVQLNPHVCVGTPIGCSLIPQFWSNTQRYPRPGYIMVNQIIVVYISHRKNLSINILFNPQYLLDLVPNIFINYNNGMVKFGTPIIKWYLLKAAY